MGSQKKVAIGTWAYIWGQYAKNPIPLSAVVKHLHNLNFDGVELAGFAPHLDPKEFSTPARRAEVKRLLDEHNLAGVSLAANFGETPPALVEPAAYLEVLRRNLDICHDLAIPKIRVDTVSPSGELPGDMDLETYFWRTAQTWNQAAGVCEESGVKMVWEFEAAFLFNKPSEVVSMVQAVDHPNFTVLFDTFHGYNCGVLGAGQIGEKETLSGGVIEFIRILTGHIGHVHFGDCDRKVEDGTVIGTRVPFGQGVIDFSRFIKAIREAAYTGDWWAIDLGGYWPNALENTAPAKKFMDDLVERYG